jgi:transcription elongation factor/antiterminator RfaH
MQRWYVIQTKPHKEFMVRDALARLQDVQAYLPILRVKPVNPRARKVRPFFPGYLFAHADLSRVGLSAIQWNPGIVRVLGSGDEPVAISPHVIDKIRDRVREVQQQEAFASGRFRKGDRVRITTGPFEGFEGMFDTRLGGQMRARILVEFLGRLTVTEVDARYLEKVSRCTPGLR